MLLAPSNFRSADRGFTSTSYDRVVNNLLYSFYLQPMRSRAFADVRAATRAAGRVWLELSTTVVVRSLLLGQYIVTLYLDHE